MFTISSHHEALIQNRPNFITSHFKGSLNILLLHLVYGALAIIVTEVKTGGIFLFSVLGLLLASCMKKEEASGASFTHVDSLNETYLMMQDSMLHTWNVMIKDENEKLQHINRLLKKLEDDDFYDQTEVHSLQERLNQLERIRFSQKSMSNSHVVEEYDFAATTLISEIIALVESDPDFFKNKDLQQLTDLIKLADQRVSTYREEYDAVVLPFNEFLKKNGADLKEIAPDWTGELKPTFSEQEEEQP